MTKSMLNPPYFKAAHGLDIPEGTFEVVSGNRRWTVWGNGTYSCTVEEDLDGGMSYISLKREDRQPVRDWRHLQSIKNEVVGPEREAFELFPAESRLMDTSNQYHLWVLPAGERMPIGTDDRDIMDPDELRIATGATSKARQRAWQPGLSTGPRRS